MTPFILKIYESIDHRGYLLHLYFRPLTPYTHYLHVLKRAARTETTAQTEKMIMHRAGGFLKVQM